MDQRLSRPRALDLLTAAGVIVAAGALIAITAMTAMAAAAPINLSKALEAQKRLVAERPQDATVWNDLGNLLAAGGQPAEAEAAYRRAVELDPRRVEPQFNLGRLLQLQGKSEARQLYEKVLKLEPDHAWAHYQLGTLYERRGDKSRAVREYAQAFRLDPQLAFRETNPQIIENRLVTESLLLAYRRESTASEAPAIYDDPLRIRDLLVAQPGKEPGAPRSGQAPAGAPADGTASRRPSVLRKQDLPTSPNTGQATPPGSRPAPGLAGRPGMQGSNYPGAYVPPGDPAYPGGARSWTRPAPNPNLDATQPGTVVTPPPAGLYYRPNVPSTGRLETQVVPDEGG